MKQYKLKEHVTSEMLESVGFKMENYMGLVHGDRTVDDDRDVYVVLTWGNAKPYFDDKRILQWGTTDCDDDITPHIQDLIEKGWVEDEADC